MLLALITCDGAFAQTIHPEVSAATVAPSPELTTPPREAALPANLVVPDVVRPLVTTMWRQSPTFRRQCARLAEHATVTVRLELVKTVRDTTGARSKIERQDEHLDAIVEIGFRRPQRFVEHIAHELEHVLEQVDGIDLPRLARQGLDGVVRGGNGYETARARAVGRTVAREAIIS
jgi:hypothetical protein